MRGMGRRVRVSAMGSWPALVVMLLAGPSLEPAVLESAALEAQLLDRVLEVEADAERLRTQAGRPIPPPVPVPGEPVEVALGVYLIQVSNLDQILQTFDVEGYLEMTWTDLRLAFDSDAFGAEVREYHNHRAWDLLGETVWWPDIEFVNAAGGGELDRHWLQIREDGQVAYTARFSATVTSGMDLRRFPFDRQSLVIPMESYFYTAEDVVFSVNLLSTGFDDSSSLPEWDVVDVATEVVLMDYDQMGDFFGQYSRMNFKVVIDREWGFYMWKVFLPLVVIVASSWAVFWIRELDTNIAIAFTVILTVVAFNLAIADSLPKVPYLTFMDAVMAVSYISVFLSLLVIMWGHVWEARGRPGIEERIQRVSRVAFPGGLVATLGLLTFVLLA